jgi:hypothetical protein
MYSMTKVFNRRSFSDHPHPFTAGFAAGVLGAFVISVVISIFRALGLQLLSFEMILGSVFIGRASTGAWILGFAWHLLNGGLFGLVYVAAFKTIGRANIMIGILFGFIQWIVAGYGIGTVPVLRVPPVYRLVPDTGFFHSSSSVEIVVAYLFLLLLFGAIIGAVVGREGRRGSSSVNISPSLPVDKAA